MSLTTIDAKTALVVIDLQQGIVSLVAPQVAAQVVRHASALTAAFRRHGLPVVLVNVAGAAPGRNEQMRSLSELPAGWTDLIAELDQQPQDHLVTKHSWGAFTNTDLQAYLQQQGVTQLVLAGISTSIGVESTARAAYELGFNLTLALDAMTDSSPDAHQHSVTRIFPRLGETGSSQQIIDLLDQTHA